MFLSSTIFLLFVSYIKTIYFFQKYFKNTIRVYSSLDPDWPPHFFGIYLGQNIATGR